MICKKCGKYSPDYNKACMYCGEIFSEVGNDQVLCKTCGKYSPKGVTCIHCGAVLVKTNKSEENKSGFYDSPAWKNAEKSQQYGLSKTGVGVLLALFLGIIGLIIGLLLYPYNTYERETFINGWVKCLIVHIIIVVVISIGCCAGLSCGLSCGR